MTERRQTLGGGKIANCEDTEQCQTVSCEECLKEIPSTVADTFEGPEYVHYFCGLNCLDKFKQKRG